MAGPGSPSNPFPAPLGPDPAIALRPESIRLPKRIPGPVHGAQFVLEIAGPKSIRSTAAHALLNAQWQGQLGHPEIFVMAPADNAWRLMSTTDGSGSYDSLALAWDVVGDQGNLSSASVKHLLKVAEQFAIGVERRTFPFPDPNKIDALASALVEAREAYDIGVELILQGPGSTTEQDIWSCAAALGLDLAPDGTFVWRVEGWAEPILTLAPYEEGILFSLRNAKTGATHEALSLGFNVPTSPDPISALENMFKVSEAFGSRLGMASLDEDGRSVDERMRNSMRANLTQALKAMEATGLKPGSDVTRKLF